ncbi:MAG: hypothetical protein IPP97_08600 [Candidatus Obscuribacter sp.]|jgi:hypothetical protein|nr:hypothetical protein [Candidatus Obscuribacter sp.]MBP6350774.1 hypothetical protein [Candidatus Obscuribacter sp.]MBP6592438.1 hypothetical protein [Candidatus Obscuribacter sp.]MBP7575909.1 hypothetical protein [Candidatus Obscuribacter sp.]
MNDNPPVRRVLLGTVVVLFLTFQATEAKPPDPKPIKPIEPSHSWQALKGKVSFEEIASDEPDIIFCTIQKAGPHFVTLGNRLYLANESIPQKERIKGIRNHQFVMRSDAESMNIMPATNSSGWDAWVIKLARKIADEWTSELPGKQDLILKIGKDGKIEVLESIAFTPAIDQNAKFVTEVEKPGLETAFTQSITRALNQAKTNNSIPFPAGSTATCAVITATFTVDKNLDVWIPDLRKLKNVPNDQRSLWIARICSLLDAGCLYEVSDVLRKELPLSTQIHFIPDDAFRSINAVGTACVDYGPFSKSILTPEAKGYLLITLKHYLKENRYLEAELLAKRVSTDCFMRTACKNHLTPQEEKHGTFNDVDLDLQYVKAKKRTIEVDFRKPMPESKKFFI